MMSNLTKFILILQIVVFLVNSYLGILVFRSEKSRFNILFCIYTLGLAFWNLALFMTITAIGGPIMQLWCSRLAFSFGVILFNSFLYFVLIYPNITRVKLWVEIALGIVTAVPLFFTLTPLLIKGNIKIISGFITGEFGPLMSIFSFYLPIFILLSLIILIWKLFRYKGIVRARIWYTLVGFAFFAIPMIITNLILPIFFNNFKYNSLGPIFSLPMVAVIAYVIVRHRFMGIRQAVARLVTYLFLIVFLGVVYAVGVSLTTSLIIKDPSALSNLGISALFAVAMAFLFQPLRSFFEKITNRFFYQQNYDGNRLLYGLALIMSSSLRLNDLTRNLLDKILSEIHINRGAFVLVDDKKIFHLSCGGYKRKPNFNEEELDILANQSEIVIFDELPDNSLKEIMKKLEIKVIIPLRTRKGHDNILILGEKMSGEPYTDQDTRVLDVFAPVAAVAINNTVSVEQIIQLDDLKSEFITVVSHQLRTPLSVARWNFELLLDGSFGPLSSKVKNITKDTYRALMDLNQGLNNLMLVLEIEEKKMALKYDTIDFNQDILQEVFASFKKDLEAKNIKVFKNLLFKKLVKLDRHKILEVIKSLLANAIEYSSVDSRIKISTTLVKKSGRSEFLFSIEDQGIGIVDENRKFVFQKFFRGDEAKKKSPNGFGLSLFIARAFIELHGGRIWLEEKDGSGVLLSFSLPV